MAQNSQLAEITNYPRDPLVFFESLLQRWDTSKLITMNLATLDSEFGVLNRTVVYRGIVDGAIAFVTERDTRKYQNLKQNAKVGLTLLFADMHGSADEQLETWQVRLIDAEAIELNATQIAQLWTEEPVFAKIRSHICECGKPVQHAELQQQHDRLLQEYESGRQPLDQTKTYTAFKIWPKRWDFYKSGANKIADRLQYRRRQQETDDQWEIMHVAA